MENRSTEKPLAYEAYQSLADHYAAGLDTKPHNAYYDRPAMVALWPDLKGKRVLDAGCGPGLYMELLIARGAVVTAFDVSERMIEHARRRCGPDADLRQIDMNQPLNMFEVATFDFINAPLCLDYIENWNRLFLEFHRILKPGGRFQFSCGHPAFDAEYHRTNHYFGVEQVQCTWKGFGKVVVMPSFRRSLQEMLMPLVTSGFRLAKIVEPLPTEDFKLADPVRYRSLMHRPAFVCVQAIRD